jgi:hypothetical protein
VLFRVDIEDRSEPGNSHAGGSTAPHDRHRIRIWILTDAELARLNNPNDRLLDFRRAIACSPGSTALSDGAVGPDRKPVPLGTAVFGVRAPDIDDGGVMNHGNHQIHPGHKPCSEGNRGTSFDVGPLASSFVPVCPKSTDYWKANPSMWVGFTANQDIGTVFDKAGKKTVKHSLVEALGGKGISPSERDLLAQAVTGLLNAGYLGEDYPFAVRDIIAGVNMALANGQSTGIQTLTSLLREANQNTDCQSTSP